MLALGRMDEERVCRAVGRGHGHHGLGQRAPLGLGPGSGTSGQDPGSADRGKFAAAETLGGKGRFFLYGGKFIAHRCSPRPFRSEA